MNISAKNRVDVQDLLAFIDAAPSPWHAVEAMAERLRCQGFTCLHETDAWSLREGQGYFVVRGGSSIIAFVLGTRSPLDTGLCLIGAHTDSPGLRLKPQPALSGDGLARLGVEVYGGPILASFADRDLSLAGRVGVRTAQGYAMRLLRFETPLLRLANLAIHMNREVNEQGLKFHKQNELPLIFGSAIDGMGSDTQFRAKLAESLAVEPTDILSWELAAYDTQKGAFWGAEQEFIASSRLDNLASCHAALSALLALESPEKTSLCGFFDHEEVGSGSAVGAGGSFITDVLARLALHHGLSETERQQAIAKSFFVSADMAHAYHPNFPAAYEPSHHVAVNAGPVIKTNANQRYSTGAESAARFIACCESVGVPCQQYAHRTDLGCGSTIGPQVAARLGIASVDVGSPMWAMHSIRESAGVLDHIYMISALQAVFKAVL